MADVSVIIPVWNTQDYLNQCLDSVQNQTLSKLDIICVDDGSSDGSVEIIRARSGGDSRVRLLSQEHQGPGAARNFGIDQARGEYLYFLDSDDWIVPDALERLVHRARGDSADLLFFESINGERTSHGGWRVQRLRHQLATRLWKGVDYLEPALAANAYSFSPCLQLSRRSLVRDSAVRYPLHDMSEDSVFTIQLTLRADRVSYRPEQLFYRRLRPGSLTTRGNPVGVIRGALHSWLAISSSRREYQAGSSTARALEVLAQRHWRHALNQWDVLPQTIKTSLTWQNILENEEQVSLRFLNDARRGRPRRAAVRFLRRRKPLVIEPAPSSSAG